MQVGFRILHPLFDGMSISWTEADGVDVTYFQALNEDNPEFTLSPFYWMIREGIASCVCASMPTPSWTNFRFCSAYGARAFPTTWR